MKLVPIESCMRNRETLVIVHCVLMTKNKGTL